MRAHQKSDASAVRLHNITLVLRTVQAEVQISQADLARRLGLARSTVLAIVDDLLELGLLKEQGHGVSGGGRRPMMLTLDDVAYHLVGVDIGATHVTVVVMNLKAEVLARQHRAFGTREDPKGTLALVEELIGRVLSESRAGRRQVVGIGVGVPSPVDLRTPGFVSPVVMPSWAGVDIAGRLQGRFGVPVRVENDANLGALWEARWGHGANVGTLAYIKVATGIGSGLVIDGRIYRGARGVAGELGHLPIDSSGPLCVCGLRGCLNTLIGTHNLLERAKGKGKGKRRFEVLDDLLDAALAGDAVATGTIEYAGRQLGLGVAMLLNLFNPALVVVGGDIVRTGDLLFAPLRETVSKNCFSENFSHVHLVASRVGESATARGAATLLFDEAIESPASFFEGAARSLRLAV
ncbi:MAG: ROK family transcriptional regulator [Myxococcaceae bacterium]|nr:ROK family transcriptional regulator [Myxococcaceae bacterium]